MKLGVHLPTSGPHATPEAILSIARFADERGLHSVWLHDHLVTPVEIASRYPYNMDGHYSLTPEQPFFEALTVLAHVSAVTTNVRLGTLVLIPALRHPVLLAKQVATLDQLAGGRVVLGVGTGWMHEEFTVLDVGFERRGARLEEHVGLMRNAWKQGVAGFDGHFYRTAEVGMYPVPQAGQVPILFGGHSDAALDRVARIGDGWAVTATPSDDLLAAYAERLRRLRELCDRAGRNYDDLLLVAQAAPTAGVDHFRRLAGLGIQVCNLISYGRPDLTLKLLDRLPNEID